jgi:hypothetical protein
MPWAWRGTPKALSSFNSVLFLECEIVEQNLGHLHLRIYNLVFQWKVEEHETKNKVAKRLKLPKKTEQKLQLLQKEFIF